MAFAKRHVTFAKRRVAFTKRHVTFAKRHVAFAKRHVICAKVQAPKVEWPGRRYIMMEPIRADTQYERC